VLHLFNGCDEETMSLIPFPELPDDSQLWVFGLERKLTSSEEKQFLTDLDTFLSSWSAHGEMLICGREFRSSQFLFTAVDLTSVPPSGCSIDGLVHFLKAQELRLSMKIIDNSAVWYRENGEVKRTSRQEFHQLAKKGCVSLESTVFDNSICRLSDLRQGRWQRLARDSWHKSMFS